MNDNLLSNGKLKDSYFARPITKNDDYIPYEVVEKYKQALEEIREILNKECGVISNAKVVGIINEVLNDRD